MRTTEIPTATLNNGERMPFLGAGMYQVPPGSDAGRVAATALRLGYRHIDTAQAYRNESDVKEGLRASGVPREEVFITTKMSPSNAGFDRARASFFESLQRLGTDYIDLFLIHWPVHGARTASWKALEKLSSEGLCRSIGVSNYTIRHLRELEAEGSIVPAVNQVEFHPFLFQKELLEYCQSHRIQLEAYSPLARSERLTDPVIAQVARETGHSPAQVMLRWGMQHDVVVIPKSTHEVRLKENLESTGFELSSAQMHMLDSLDENYRTCWDPTDAP
jgi:diketogulonate reductase-like aldo/keto reductase